MHIRIHQLCELAIELYYMRAALLCATSWALQTLACCAGTFTPLCGHFHSAAQANFDSWNATPLRGKLERIAQIVHIR